MNEYIFVLIGTGPFLALFIIHCLCTCGGCCYCLSACCKCGHSVQSIINKTTRKVFIFFKKGSTENETMMFNYVVSNKAIFSLFISSVVFFLFSLCIFWQMFIISQEDCYNAHTDTRLLCFEDSVPKDCTSVHLDKENFTFVGCYKIAEAFGNPFVTATGLFTSHILFTSIVTFLLVSISGGKTGSKKRKWIAYLVWIGLMFVLLFASAYLFSIVFWYYIDYNYQWLSHINYCLFLYGEGFSIAAIQWRNFTKVSEQSDDRRGINNPMFHEDYETV